MGIRKIRTVFLAMILSVMPITGLLAIKICLPCVEANMQPYCQALKDAGLLKEGITLQDFANEADQELTTCESVLAEGAVKRRFYRRDLVGPYTPLTSQSFCEEMLTLGIIGIEKKQACHDFYQTHPLPY